MYQSTSNETIDRATETSTDDEAPETAHSVEPDHGDPLTDFTHELARAMRAAAEQELERMSAGVTASLEAHVEKVRARAAAEAEGFRHLADEDLDRIRDWSKAETARIQEETDHRIDARRQQLERHIEQHASITEREVGSIESAIEGYRAELDRFFARLTTEEDPTEFATLAGRLPALPDLEEIGGNARARALDEFRGPPMGSGETPAPEGSDEGEPSAFSPTERGPGLVGVMTPEDETASTEAEPPAEGEEPEDAPAAANGTLQRLRSFAGLSGPRREE